MTLIERLAAAERGSRTMDLDVWRASGSPAWQTTADVDLSRPALPTNQSYMAPQCTTSLDAIIALIEQRLPGAWWIISRGRLRAAEPLYGCQILFGTVEVLGEGESNAGPALAACCALLAAIEQEPDHE